MTEYKLYLIPSPINELAPEEMIPQGTLEVLRGLRVFVVEELRTARRYLSAAGLKGHIDELEFHTLNEHTDPSEVKSLLPLFSRSDVGLISEAGLPAVADPGASLVALCQQHGIDVVPLSGPSSLMLALMASGLDGQSFAFRGYLPAKPEERRQALKGIEKMSAQLHQTQIFIETPYRNDAMLSDCLNQLSPSTRLCVAASIGSPEAYIRTKSVGQWKQEQTLIGKRPCVFLILAK